MPHIIKIHASILWIFLIGLIATQATYGQSANLLPDSLIGHYVRSFNSQDEEKFVNLISNAQAADWLAANVPLFQCPDSKLEEVYYYRWWTFRKHLKETPHGYIFTEFITPVKHAGEFNSISCALGHHIYEGRWLRQPRYINQYIDFWLKYEQHQPKSKFHNFSNWISDAVYKFYLVHGDKQFATDRLDLMDKDFKYWERERLRPDSLFWQYDVRDGMEESVSGGRRVKNARPTINAYMYGNALALARIAEVAGNDGLQEHYLQRAAEIKALVDKNLWDDTAKFYKTKLESDGSLAPREAIGFIPWYFNLPDDASNYAEAWSQLNDTLGFNAPWGLTTAERREPTFRTRGSGHGCEWDGAVWPFATTQTLKGLANLLTGYRRTGDMIKAVFYRELWKYANSHQKQGKLYLGEYQDEKTGYWLKGDSPRSEFYNHSGFCDLVISDLIGFKPMEGDRFALQPLIPEGQWEWFCLDRIPYHGKTLTIIWDVHGTKYGKGKGLRIYADGELVKKSKRLRALEVTL